MEANYARCKNCRKEKQVFREICTDGIHNVMCGNIIFFNNHQGKAGKIPHAGEQDDA
jgi:hypothetical protein